MIQKRIVLIVLLVLAAPVVAIPQFFRDGKVSPAAFNQYLSHAALPSDSVSPSYQASIEAWQGIQPEAARFIGEWHPPVPDANNPDGFVAVYPSQTPNLVCVLVNTQRRVLFGEGMIDGDRLYLRDEKFAASPELGYLSSSLFALPPQGQGQLVWSVAAPDGAPRFLPLQFTQTARPVGEFLVPGRDDEVKQSLTASGCQYPLVQLNAATALSVGAAPASESLSEPLLYQSTVPTPSQAQTLAQVTIGIGQAQTNNSISVNFPLSIANESEESFGFTSNSIRVLDVNGRKLTSKYQPIGNFGNFVRPGGVGQGLLTVYTQTSQATAQPPLTIQVQEGTLKRREFKINVP